MSTLMFGFSDYLRLLQIGCLAFVLLPFCILSLTSLLLLLGIQSPLPLQLLLLVDLFLEACYLVLISLVDDARCLPLSQLPLELPFQLFLHDAIVAFFNIEFFLKTLGLFLGLLLLVLANLNLCPRIVQFVLLRCLVSFGDKVKFSHLFVELVDCIRMLLLLPFDLLLQLSSFLSQALKHSFLFVHLHHCTLSLPLNLRNLS